MIKFTSKFPFIKWIKKPEYTGPNVRVIFNNEFSIPSYVVQYRKNGRWHSLKTYFCDVDHVGYNKTAENHEYAYKLAINYMNNFPRHILGNDIIAVKTITKE